MSDKPRGLARLLVEGRKGSAFQQSLVALLFITLLVAVDIAPFSVDLDSTELTAILAALAGLKATFTAGNYGEHAGVHYLNLKAMLDTPETAYARLDFFADRVVVRGVGRQTDYVLPLRP